MHDWNNLFIILLIFLIPVSYSYESCRLISDFEDQSNIWYGANGATVELSSQWKASGISSLMVTAPASSYIWLNLTSCGPGIDLYRITGFSFHMNITKEANAFSYYVEFKGDMGKQTFDPVDSDYLKPTIQWTNISSDDLRSKLSTQFNEISIHFSDIAPLFYFDSFQICYQPLEAGDVLFSFEEDFQSWTIEVPRDYGQENALKTLNRSPLFATHGKYSAEMFLYSGLYPQSPRLDGLFLREQIFKNLTSCGLLSFDIYSEASLQIGIQIFSTFNQYSPTETKIHSTIAKIMNTITLDMQTVGNKAEVMQIYIYFWCRQFDNVTIYIDNFRCSKPLPPPTKRNSSIILNEFVKTIGSNFTLNGDNFFFAGANNPYIGRYISIPAIDNFFNEALLLNFTVMRVDGYRCSGTRDKSIPRISPDNSLVYYQYWENNISVLNNQSDGIVLLDYVIKSAKDRGIRLIIPFVNNWISSCGMDQYLTWVYPNTSFFHDQFYTDSTVRLIYQDYVRKILERNNTYTGILYKDEPTILGWQLANSPQCSSDLYNGSSNCNSSVIYNWASIMSSFIKGIDNKHLVSVGDSGYYNEENSENDFEGYLNIPTIDFGTITLKGESFNLNNTKISQWIQKHANSSTQANKPVIIQDYSVQGNNPVIYQQWTNIFETYRIDGTLFYFLGSVIIGTSTDDTILIGVTSNSVPAKIFQNHSLDLIHQTFYVPPPTPTPSCPDLPDFILVDGVCIFQGKVITNNISFTDNNVIITNNITLVSVLGYLDSSTIWTNGLTFQDTLINIANSSLQIKSLSGNGVIIIDLNSHLTIHSCSDLNLTLVINTQGFLENQKYDLMEFSPDCENKIKFDLSNTPNICYDQILDKQYNKMILSVRSCNHFDGESTILIAVVVSSLCVIIILSIVIYIVVGHRLKEEIRRLRNLPNYKEEKIQIP